MYSGSAMAIREFCKKQDVHAVVYLPLCFQGIYYEIQLAIKSNQFLQSFGSFQSVKYLVALLDFCSNQDYHHAISAYIFTSQFQIECWVMSSVHLKCIMSNWQAQKNRRLGILFWDLGGLIIFFNSDTFQLKIQIPMHWNVTQEIDVHPHSC